ncbi:glycine zipper 2TM domain-containing protein [Stenotrophomonas sp.]|uniref:glycine zipper 2TM domain-containing protein n=1 Tax=Stenotrophomonas sp. TaxID=69392 RepID=UPI002FCB0984
MLNLPALSLRGLAMALALTAGLAVVSDASALSRKDKRTVVGAVVGGVAGHLISNGDPTATVGGAVAGGAIGNLTTRDRHDNRYDRRYDNRRYNDRRYGYDRGHDRRYDRNRWEHQQRDRRDWDRRHGRGW